MAQAGQCAWARRMPSRSSACASPLPRNGGPITTRPMLTSGSADPAVHELGRALAELGYDNSVSQGLNPYGIVDETVLQAVSYFRRDHEVEEDRQALPGPVEEHGRWIGQATWDKVAEALEEHRADEKAKADEQADEDRRAAEAEKQAADARAQVEREQGPPLPGELMPAQQAGDGGRCELLKPALPA